MILLNEVVEIFPLPQFTNVWQNPLSFELFERLWIGWVYINGDDSMSVGMRRSRRIREEMFDCLSISCGTKEKFQSFPLRIHGTIEIHPCFFHFHIGLIDAPRVVRHLEMGPTTLLSSGA
jgi:hypothetical protein